jgi:hypothetical protein
MAREWYTDESWKKVLDAHKRGAKTQTLKAKNRRKEYLKNPKICKQCGKIIPFERRLRYNVFCNHACSALYNNPNRRKPRYCIECKKELNRYSKKFCSHFCDNTYKYKYYISKWLSGEISGSAKHVPSQIERWIREQRGEQCWFCGWKEINPVTNKIPLQVNHIDGHSSNNRPENIELICPNCHSLTPTFGALNKGNGRSWRYSK